jgi:prepilin-type N-terminal cleavage/methylation domain-containing protein
MRGSNKGFSLLELLVVVAIMGILMSIVVPNFRNLLPGRERKLFIEKLNGLMRSAWQRALVERKLQKVSFDFDKRSIWLESATGAVKEGNPEFTRAKESYTLTAVQIPKVIDVKNFIIEGFDEMGRYGSGRKTTESWFYIIPDGMAQAVTINFLDKSNVNAAGKPRQFGLVLNPFNAQFKVYDAFQK